MLDNFAQRQYNSILLISVPGCSAVGSVLGSGPRGREFKSRHSDQKSTGFDKKPVDLFLYAERACLPRKSVAFAFILFFSQYDFDKV